MGMSSHSDHTDFDAEGALGDEHVAEGHKSEHAFRTISEVSQDIDVPQHVLRFWESKFSQIRPLKRGGGRRYYRPEDVELIRRIKNYLYNQGYTIKGVQRLLKDRKEHGLVAAAPSFVPYATPQSNLPPLPAAPIVTQASMLHAASVSPSALAMAYGAIAAQVGEGSAAIKAARFPDAFAEATTHIADEVMNFEAYGQLARSLEAVTKLYEEINADVKPIRITNLAAPRYEDGVDVSQPEMVMDTALEKVGTESTGCTLVQEVASQDIQAPATISGLEFNFAAEATVATAAQAVPVPQIENSENNENDEGEEVAEDAEEMSVTLLNVTEVVIEQDDFSPKAKAELCAVLEELTALRDYMRSALSA